MKSSKRVVAVRKLLDLCDDLQRIRTQMSDPGLRRETRTRLRQQSKRKSDTLQRDLRSYRFRGPLGSIIREFKLTAEHFQVLSTLLQRQLCAEEPAIEGRLLLASVFETSFDVLAAMELLHEDSPLRASGLVVVDCDDEYAENVLEARFRLSDRAIDSFRHEAIGVLPEDQRRRKIEGYASNRDLLIDLRVVHNLYQLRAERVFDHEHWDRVHADGNRPGKSITRRIATFWTRIGKRLDATPDANDLPVVRFIREQSLEDEEVVMTVHLLFKELYEGNAYADAAQLIRLVSESEADLIRNRRLVLPQGTLMAAEIIQMEPMIENRELTGEVHLSDWAVNYLFGATRVERKIHPDERLDWHLYLKNLDDTGTFFRDMGAN